jgi:hypothetical protein
MKFDCHRLISLWVALQILAGSGVASATTVGYWRMEVDAFPLTSEIEVANEVAGLIPGATMLIASSAIIDLDSNPNSEARTRTPMAFYGSTSRKAPTSANTVVMTSPPLPLRSTRAHARPLDGRPLPNR